MIDGETGCLVPPDDPDALAERVLALLRDPVLRARMGRVGRAHVLENFTAAAYAGRVIRLIDGWFLTT
jgi:glycosyltransferase involved in cell wall biosynthesis